MNAPELGSRLGIATIIIDRTVSTAYMGYPVLQEFSILQLSVRWSSVTGLDLVALLFLLHVWAAVVAIATYANGPESGVRLAGRRVSIGSRLYAAVTLLATIVVWLPFAAGEYPFWPGEDGTGTVQGIFFATVLAAAAVGAGFYFLGGALSTAGSALGLRRTGPTDIAAVEPGLVSVAGTVVPIDEPLSSPMTETDAVWYRLSATTEPATTAAPEKMTETEATTGTDAQRSATALTGAIETLRGWLGSSDTERTASRQLDIEHAPFRLEDETGAIVVDPTHATVELGTTEARERDQERVQASESPPEPLATHIQSMRYVEDVDRDRTYREATLEPGETVRVVGIARRPEAGRTTAHSEPAPQTQHQPRPRHLVAARKPSTELFIARDREFGVGSTWFRKTVIHCLFWAATAIVGGSAVLWWLAGHV